MRRHRKTKIVATIGPASASESIIHALFEAGVDVFRLNFSHGSHSDHKARLDILRAMEKRYGRPVGVLLDLQGPKLRIGVFADGPVKLQNGAPFRLDLNKELAGDDRRVALPHPEIFAALEKGADLLVDDGRIRLRVTDFGPDFAETTVINGGLLSDRKGVNVPGVILPLSAMTDKDRADLDYGLSLGVDWVALSFVQRPEDIREIKALINGRAGVVAKIEKPAAIAALAEIIAETDAVMVARGDLGVELPAAEVPPLQKQIVRSCRAAGKPVIVATQMLESMVSAPVPTRAEASDVATAVYDGADAVMLSAESASGQFPLEAVQMMDNIIKSVEKDGLYRQLLEATHVPEQETVADAICNALRRTCNLLHAKAAVSYTTSGFSSLRAARERPESPILSLTPRLDTARRMTLVWGVHSIEEPTDITSVKEMLDHAIAAAREYGFGETGDHIVIIAGMPFGNPGTTNMLNIVKL